MRRFNVIVADRSGGIVSEYCADMAQVLSLVREVRQSWPDKVVSVYDLHLANGEQEICL